MKKFKKLSLLATAVGLCASTHATTVYVKAFSAGLNNGTSWANAYTNLQTAAASNADTIWIANGTYKPTTGTDRTQSFKFGGKKVFGGFSGVETQLSQRDYSGHLTILDGNLGNQASNIDNSYHVVVVTATGGLIDGVQIRRGNANDNAGNDDLGGGVKILGASGTIATIKNTLIIDNIAVRGGGVSNTYGADVLFENCEFMDNTATIEGGAMFEAPVNALGRAEFQDCKLHGNTALNGGAIMLAGLVDMRRCVCSGNEAADKGGAIHVAVSPGRSILTMDNSLLVGNKSADGSAVFCTEDLTGQALSFAAIHYSTFSGNMSVNNSSALVLPIKSQISNSIIWGNLTGTSPQINSASNAYNNIIQGGANPANYNFSFDPQFINPGNVAFAPFNNNIYNYQVTEASEAVDKGRKNYSPVFTQDLNQHLRQFGVNTDLGCYEKEYCMTTGNGQISVDGNDTSFCQGSAIAVKLTAPMGIRYNWSNYAATDTTTALGAGIYKVAVLNANGCRAIYTKTIVEVPLPVPAILNNNGMLSAGTFSSYQWMKDNVDIPGATSQVYSPSTAGNYKVRVTNVSGCAGTSVAYTFMPLAIDEINNQSRVHLYPNPAKDRFTVDISALSGNVHAYTICDIMGKRVIQKDVTTKAGTLEVLLPETLANGLYILNLYTSEATLSTKVEIRR